MKQFANPGGILASLPSLKLAVVNRSITVYIGVSLYNVVAAKYWQSFCTQLAKCLWFGPMRVLEIMQVSDRRRH